MLTEVITIQCHNAVNRIQIIQEKNIEKQNIYKRTLVHTTSRQQTS